MQTKITIISITIHLTRTRNNHRHIGVDGVSHVVTTLTSGEDIKCLTILDDVLEFVPIRCTFVGCLAAYRYIKRTSGFVNTIKTRTVNG